jgi:hypothetical protein
VSSFEVRYLETQRTMFAHIFTGHSSGSSDLNCIIVSFLVSFFCSSKVIDTHSAR